MITGLLAEMHKITPDQDAKLQHLKTQVNSKISSPINPGNKKILPVHRVRGHRRVPVQAPCPASTQRPQDSHRHRHGWKHAANNSEEGLRLPISAYPLSPRSKEKALTIPDEPGQIDILIATDCISEGQNLQDCDYLINYDIHWNPVRIIQRFGRIDRIGSVNATIQLVNYWPDITLDEYIRLKERVENRMVIADVTATGDDNPLTAEANDVSYRKEQLRKLQEEVIDMEDLKTGVSITDLGLNDFRMDLLNYVKTAGDLSNLPSGLHAVVPADPHAVCTPASSTRFAIATTQSTSTSRTVCTRTICSIWETTARSSPSTRR